MKEHDIVKTIKDTGYYRCSPGNQKYHTLPSGSEGTIVHCYKDNEAFEVEFPNGAEEPVVIMLLKTDLVKV